MNESLQMMKCVELSNVLMQIILVRHKNRIILLICLFLLSLLGYITVTELYEVLNQLNQNISEQRIADVLNEIDTDQDGKISYEEFVRMLEEV